MEGEAVNAFRGKDWKVHKKRMNPYSFFPVSPVLRFAAAHYKKLMLQKNPSLYLKN